MSSLRDRTLRRFAAGFIETRSAHRNPRRQLRRIYFAQPARARGQALRTMRRALALWEQAIERKQTAADRPPEQAHRLAKRAMVELAGLT